MNDLVDGCKIEGKFYVGATDIYGKIDVNELRKNVGMVFQKPNPFPMSVYDNIAYGPRTFGITKHSELDEIVETSLKQAAMWDELKDRLNKSALGLSGGQQRRLCIARSLAANPKILLMDEPTSALDPISTGKIEELMEELKKEIQNYVKKNTAPSVDVNKVYSKNNYLSSLSIEGYELSPKFNKDTLEYKIKAIRVDTCNKLGAPRLFVFW